jgi:hypothetical protein
MEALTISRQEGHTALVLEWTFSVFILLNLHSDPTINEDILPIDIARPVRG